ncbi:MAG TPA: carboxypeptidase-like regulatory domain-containing protein [Polyangiaceae bacterium]
MSAAAVAVFATTPACSSSPDEKVIVVPGWGPSSPGPAPSGASSSGASSSSGSGAGAGSSSGGSSSGGTTADGGTGAASGVPCDVATMLAANCTGCHSDPPAPGALAGLVTYADLKATAQEDPTKNEAQLSLSRMQSSSSPMPPSGPLPASDVTTLQNWINAGYPMGSCASGSSSGGSSSGASGDGGSAMPPVNVFNNAPPFVSQAGRSTHNAGKDCLQCHANGGGDAPQFSFGGTLYDGNGNPVVGAEVRLVDANGNATSVHTSSTGTFYSEGSGFAAPAYVGARDATNMADMLVALQSSGGGCSSCHCTGTGCSTTPMHLP